jgi:hypothetical protein
VRNVEPYSEVFPTQCSFRKLSERRFSESSNPQKKHGTAI